MPPESASQHAADEPFLRSINVQYDATAPERIQHFQPTAKTALITKALLGLGSSRAHFIVAPYGSGKSLTAAYALHVVENSKSAQRVLAAVGRRLRKANPELADRVRERQRRPDHHGLVLALHGHCPNVPAALHAAAIESMKRLGLLSQLGALAPPAGTTQDNLRLLLEGLAAGAAASGCDRILVIWDEFGRHLETLLREARTVELADIQSLAEFASRETQVPVTVGLLLHQNILQYAGSMTQSVRSEWTKIEGRFQTIQYIDDSAEVYRLIADVVCRRRPGPGPAADRTMALARRCLQQRLFGKMPVDDVCRLLEHAYPLEPVTLYLLPRLAARVAQNERTLFGFLYDLPLDAPVTPAALYDFFSPVMRADTAVGGTYRRWLETQSALSRSQTDEEAEAIKAACLLGLGTSGERARARRELLMLALEGYGAAGTATEVVEALVGRKLLLHRRHSDEVTVWHGTDADLRTRLDGEKARHRDEFDGSTFLAHEARPPYWLPTEYNDEYCVRRYLGGRYITVSGLEWHFSLEHAVTPLPIDSDGEVLYVLAETQDELASAEAMLRRQLASDRMVAVLPREPLPIREAALEVWCLLQMQADVELVSTDPLVTVELQQMADDARGHLQQLLDRLVLPGTDGGRWLYLGEELPARSARELRVALSAIMRRVFGLTPRINNEMIVRRRPSSVVINARKKLLLALLERCGQERLGIVGNFPDHSVFRCVLLQTGLYRQLPTGRWAFAPPEDVADTGLRAVWRRIHLFLTEPSASPKEPQYLINELSQPPYGVRAGVMPVLFTAGLVAFRSALSVTRDGHYVSDLLPSTIEEMFRSPARYRIAVLALDVTKTEYLRAFQRCFSAGPPYEVPEADLIRLCYDALEAWKVQLPPASMTTRQLSEQGARFQRLLQRERDPVSLILAEVPACVGHPIERLQPLMAALEACKSELMSVAQVYADRAVASVRRVLGVPAGGNGGLRACALAWSQCFPPDFVAGMPETGTPKGLLTRMAMRYGSDTKLVDSLASLLVGRPVARWDDTTAAQFERELHAVVQEVEERALDRSASVRPDGPASAGLARLVQRRMAGMYAHLANLVGDSEAAEMLASLAQTRTEVPNG